VSDVVNGGVRLHVEVEGTGEPVTVFAHGLTNSCRELAAFTPLVAGTKVRFCFRGHGHSDCPSSGYAFADFARDLDAVARSCGASCAVGTSLGAGAIMHLLAADPARFERMIFLLPAGLDTPLERPEGLLATADALETMGKAEAVEAIMSDPGRAAAYTRQPWLRDVDLALWEDMNPAGVARAIRGIVGDRPVSDREALRRVEAPVLIICREGDRIHPAELGRILDHLMANAELLVFRDEVEMLAAAPMLVQRAAEFLRAGGAPT
jgi:pimeloyl-ACP methyl ester carboxylesterase